MNSKCVLFAIGLLACRVCAADPHVATDPIDLAAIAALPMDPGQAEVLVHLDLSKPFATKSQWTFGKGVRALFWKFAAAEPRR